jgi:hypothetical protein
VEASRPGARYRNAAGSAEPQWDADLAARNVHQTSFLFLLGVAHFVTESPVLARILGEIKLLGTDLGRIAMSVAFVNDMCAWILLAIRRTPEGEGVSDMQVTLILTSVMLAGVCTRSSAPSSTGWSSGHPDRGVRRGAPPGRCYSP